MNEQSISVRHHEFDVDLLQGGTGKPVLFLHGISGLQWTPFLERLSGKHTVIAPRTPGFGESTGIELLDDVGDMVFFYLDLLDELNLHDIPLVGHSIGGMFAAELAAAQPDRFSHVILASSFGLWDTENPVTDLFAVSHTELARCLYADPENKEAVAVATAPEARMTEVDPDTEDGKATIKYLVERAKSMSTAAKYLWPIPNRGLRKRLHRVQQPGLVIWGESDGIIPSTYAQRFTAQMENATAHIVPNAAHMVIDEQPDHVADLIENLLSS
jgi:pimeloyl-ACP methyl ester carboxylesterase